MSLVRRLARTAILDLQPTDIAGAPQPGMVRLDANENPFSPLVQGHSDINRYPEPQPERLRRRMADLYGVPIGNLWVTRGSDDAIDLLIRTFCEAGRDSVAIVEPTFSAYRQFACIQGAGVVAVRASSSFEVDADALVEQLRPVKPKLLFLCTPNNPTGMVVANGDIRRIATALPETIVIVDEAYGEFDDQPSMAPEATGNLVVLRTLSKAYGLAGARVGCLIGAPELVELVSRVSPPYPLPLPSIRAALDVLGPERMPVHRQRIATILAQRECLAEKLRVVPEVKAIREGGNFLFLEVDDASDLAARMTAAGVRVRFRPAAAPGGVRVTVGTAAENAILLGVFGLSEAAPTRASSIVRDTKETRIVVEVDLDRAEPRQVDSGIPFYDHMLDQVAAHGGFSLTLGCTGDVDIDPHHSVEDCAIALGQALRAALGDKRGIARFGFALPMDEAEAQVLIDLSGRSFARFEGDFASPNVGDFPTQMVPHVFRSLAEAMGAAIHVRVNGDNDHHKVEACFKAFGRALRQAVAREGGGDALPSTKGFL